MVVALALVALLAPALAGCARPAEPREAPDSTDPATAAPAVLDPRTLVGAWTIARSGTADDGNVLFLTGMSATLWRECGTIETSAAGGPGGQMHMKLTGGSGECDVFQEDGPTLWLVEVAGWRPAEDGIDLVRTDGELLAHLDPGGSPTVPDTIIAEAGEPPTLSPELATYLDPSRPTPPEGMRAPQAADVVGRWVPATPVKDGSLDVHVTFDARGGWRASDGCNGTEGVWALGENGWWSAPAGGSTQMYCDGAPVAEWVSQAGIALVSDDGANLSLRTPSGEEIGALVRG